MPHLDSNTKHHILLEYSANDRTRSFSALAARHGVRGGRATVHGWYRRWDGTAASLEEKSRPGRPRLLSTAQVRRHLQPRVRAANRQHRAIHYPDLLPALINQTHTSLSLRTLRRYGRQELGIKQRRCKKRTLDESKCTHVYEREAVNAYVSRVLT
jgi:hypothetical protein